ncbi:Uncharacterised protein [Legionella spiritensis]|nr:Uncharacterised protein [Legionella spiritensis]
MEKTVARKEACGRIAGFMYGRTGEYSGERFPALRLHLHDRRQEKQPIS